jgi:hypothetical protein
MAGRSPSARRRTASEISSSATLPGTAPTRTCGARRSQPLPPRWRALCPPSKDTMGDRVPPLLRRRPGPSGRTLSAVP